MTLSRSRSTSDHEPGGRHIKLALEPGRYGVANFTLCKAWVGTGNLHNQSEVVNVVRPHPAA